MFENYGYGYYDSCMPLANFFFSDQEAILQDLQRDIPKDFSFVISENNFEVISGKQEGVYAWIAVNYVLQKFGHGEEGKMSIQDILL